MEYGKQTFVVMILGTAALAGCATTGGPAAQSASSFHALSEVPPRMIAECVTEKWQQRSPSVTVSPVSPGYIVRVSGGDSVGATASIDPHGGGSSVRYTADTSPPWPPGFLSDLKLCL